MAAVVPEFHPPAVGGCIHQHTFASIYQYAFTNVHSLAYIQEQTFTSIHSLACIHQHTFTSIHSDACIHQHTFKRISTCQLKVGTFIGIHSREYSPARCSCQLVNALQPVGLHNALVHLHSPGQGFIQEDTEDGKTALTHLRWGCSPGSSLSYIFLSILVVKFREKYT